MNTMRHPLRFPIFLLALWVAACQTTLERPSGGNAVLEAYGAKDYVRTLQLTGKASASWQDRVLHAWSWFQLAHYQEALREFRAMQKDQPSRFHPWLGEAWVMMKRGRFDKVPPLLDRAERWMGQHQRPMLFAARGWLAFYRGELDRAADWFDKTEEALYFEDAEYISIATGIMQTWNTLPWVGRGWVALARGDLETAERAFSRGLEHDVRCHLCHAGLSAVAERRGNVEDALQPAIAGLRTSRHDPELVVTLNRLLLARNDLELSERVYRELVDTGDNDPLYLANLGYVWLYQGRFEDAARAFEQALAAEPGQLLATRGLAEVQPLLEEQRRMQSGGR